MSSASLSRWSGYSLVLGCALLGLGTVLRMVAGEEEPARPLLVAGWLLQMPGALLVVLGLPGVYARQVASALGLVGLVGLTVNMLVFGTFASLLHGLVLPTLTAPLRPLAVGLTSAGGAFLGMVGGVALGVAVVRARARPRPAGVLLIVGALPMFFGHGLPLHLEDVGLLVLLVGLAALGGGVLALLPPASASAAPSAAS